MLDRYILDIVQKSNIREQKDLQEILKNRGHDIPQSTLSRRLKKLKIAKLDGMYAVIDRSHQQFPLILDLQISEYGMIVMHTHPGQANSLAYFIDSKYVACRDKGPSNGILGTIAGDDTVLLIIKSKEVLQNVLDTIVRDFPYLLVEIKD